MLNLVLNIIGIILVSYSIIIIRKDISRKKIDERKLMGSRELENESYQLTEDFIEDFGQIIHNKVQKSDLAIAQNKIELDIIKSNENISPIIKEKEVTSQSNHINPLHKKIVELKSIGLTNEEIARKLGRGVREIDIILKLYKI